MNTTKLTALAVAVSGLFSMGSALAAGGTSVEGLFNNGYPTGMSDNSGEFLINVDGSTSGGGPTVTVGDIIFGISNFGTMGDNDTNIGGGTSYNELTTIFAEKVVTVGAPQGNNNQGIFLQHSTFTPLTAADTAYFDWSKGEIYLSGNGSTVTYTFTKPSITGYVTANNGLLFAALYEDSANNYTRTSTVSAGLTSATGGTTREIIEINTTVDPNDFLNADGPTILAQLAGFPANTSITGSTIGFNGTIAAQNWNTVIKSPEVIGGNGGVATKNPVSGWSFNDNLDIAQTATRTPEPGSIMLLSVGLVALGARFYKRKAV